VSAIAASAHQGPLTVGAQFLKFEICALLGQGEHGWVYDGYDPFLDRHVAIKVIPNPLDRGRELQRRAQLEARVLCKLQHRNVVHVIDAGVSDEGAVYIVMELLHGRTLRDAIRDYRQLSVAEALSLGAQIADGVQAAHEHGALHRDLKPENVFLAADNTVKVLDFGIAKLMDSAAATSPRELLNGTLLYMSPEQLQGSGLTPRSDIYALGTVLYEALAGHPPCLIGMAEPTLESVAVAQLSRLPTPLDELTGMVPYFVARTIQRMLEKQPTERFATMTEVSQLLRAHLQRFASESPDGALSQRELWRGTRSASPASGAIRSSEVSSEVTSDVHVLGSTTAIRSVAPAPGAYASNSELPYRPAAPRSTTVSRSVALQRIFSVQPNPLSERKPPTSSRPLEAEPADSQSQLTLVPASITLPQLLLSAVALGTLVGVAIGVIQGLPRPQAAPSPSSESVSRSMHPSAQHESPTVVQQAVPARAQSAGAASALPSARRPPLAASALHTPVTKPPAKKSALTAPAGSASARPVRHPRAIYGSDDGAE